MPVIPIFKPAYNTEKILSELAVIFDSGWTGLGPKSEEFEKALASYIQTDYSVFLNSGTAALHLAVECLQLPPGSRIAVPDITFVSSAAVVLYCGHIPVLLPVDDQIQLDLDRLEAVASDVDAVIVVHYSGNCCDMDRLTRICETNDLRLIEDCAHAMGATYDGKSLGTFGDIGCFSFHSVKNLPIADGGCVIGHPEYEEMLRRLRWLGIDKATYERTGSTYDYEYDVTCLGYKYHGNDLMAVVGLAGLELMDEHNARRKQIHDRYFADAPWLAMPRVNERAQSSHHLMACCIDRRDEFIRYMSERGVSIGVHYRPVSSLSRYSQYALDDVKADSQKRFEKLATLPCFPALTDEEQTYVIEMANQFRDGARADTSS